MDIYDTQIKEYNRYKNHLDGLYRQIILADKKYKYEDINDRFGEIFKDYKHRLMEDMELGIKYNNVILSADELIDLIKNQDNILKTNEVKYVLNKPSDNILVRLTLLEFKDEPYIDNNVIKIC